MNRMFRTEDENFLTVNVRLSHGDDFANVFLLGFLLFTTPKNLFPR